MQIDATMLKRMFMAGVHALNDQKDLINELNVFPVPDGDTGTNMTMTILSSAREMLSRDDDTVEAVSKAISSGALRGARGNSGVILSQLFRGFARGLAGKAVMTQDDMILATKNAVEAAYKAVMKPKEGTILTVARGLSEKSQEYLGGEDVALFLTETLAYGDEVLKHTPDLLPVLKQAGVVDSGGQGLMCILYGMLDAVKGKPVNMTLPEMNVGKPETLRVDVSDIETADIKFGYCTEFIINLEKPFTEKDEYEMKEYLTGIGDSLVLVADDDVVKIHVHTNDPGNAIQKALTYGSLSRIKIDNMREEHQERLFQDAEKLAAEQKKADAEKEALKEAPRKDVGFVAVCTGDGLKEIFTQMGVDSVIEGGQTMNPSTEDILKGIERVNADTVFVFPNNGNIVLASRQAAALAADRNVLVVPTGSVVEGISCLIGYIPGGTPEENLEAMTEQLQYVKTIEVTYAVRDSVVDGREIHENDFMALSGKHILGLGKDLKEAVLEALRNAECDDAAVVTLYYGQDVREEEAEALRDALTEDGLDAEIEVVYGGQPVYYYYIAVE